MIHPQHQLNLMSIYISVQMYVQVMRLKTRPIKQAIHMTQKLKKSRMSKILHVVYGIHAIHTFNNLMHSPQVNELLCLLCGVWKRQTETV